MQNYAKLCTMHKTAGTDRLKDGQVYRFIENPSL